MQHFIQHTKQSRLLQAIALSCVVACGGKGEKTGGEGNTSDSAGGSDGSGGNNVSSGGAATSDSASETDSGGTSGTDAGGASASTMTTASGGTSATTTAASSMGAGGAGASDATSTADTTGAGGSAGEGTVSTTGTSGGAGGTGMTGPTGAVATLGDPCDSPGELACAGNYQKLTLVCGGDGEWEVNQTCAGEQFCDSREGVTQGTCQDPDPACAGLEPGARFCDWDEVVECGADLLDSASIEVCTGVCRNGECDNEAPSCPEPGQLLANCTEECGGMLNCEPGPCEGTMNISVQDSLQGMIRLPADLNSLSPENECIRCEGTVGVVFVTFPYDGETGYYIEPEIPWSVTDVLCATASCAVTTRTVSLGVTSGDAAAVNLYVRLVSPEAVCGP